MFFWTLIFKDFINICIWGPTRAGTSRKDQHTLLGIAAPIHPSAWVSIAACNGQSDGEAVARTGRFERLTLTRTVTVETPPGTVAVGGGVCVCCLGELDAKWPAVCQRLPISLCMSTVFQVQRRECLNGGEHIEQFLRVCAHILIYCFRVRM